MHDSIIHDSIIKEDKPTYNYVGILIIASLVGVPVYLLKKAYITNKTPQEAKGTEEQLYEEFNPRFKPR